jgi:hypothetical protein
MNLERLALGILKACIVLWFALPLSALLWLALQGCAPDHLEPPYHEGPHGRCDREYLVVPNEFTTDERASLERAVSRWNAIASEKFCLVDGGTHDGEHTISKVEVGSPEWESIAKDFSAAVIGVYSSGTDNVIVMSGLGPETFEVVALHELGHAHGLDHVSPPGIMSAQIDGSLDFMPNDLAECRRVGACPSADTLPEESTDVSCTLSSSSIL